MKVFSLIKKLDEWCAKVLGWVMALMLAIQLVILFAGVIMRYFFNSPFTWSDELASLLLVCITFLGGYSALVTGKLANVTMVVDKLPRGAQKFVITMRNIAVIAVCAVIATSVIQMMGKPVVQGQVSSVLRVPMKYIYIVMPVSFIMMAFHAFVSMLEIWVTAFREKGGAEE